MIRELHDLLVAVGQRVHQHLQITHRAEQVGPRVTEPARGLRQFAQCLPERVAVAVERVGGLVDRGHQRSLHTALFGTQLGRQLGELLFDLVPLDGNAGAIEPDLALSASASPPV